MKQRIFAFFIIAITLFSTISPSANALAAQKNNSSKASNTTSASWPDGPNVYAEGAIVMEASTGLVLYEKNAQKAYYPASITKIMTALLAIENSSMGEIVTFSKNAIYDVDLDSSRIGIDVGEQLTMQQCLYAILLESANEVTYAVAEHVAGSIPAFAKMMNDRAKSLGCVNTNFMNPHGLQDENHYTTPYDMALITREAMKNPTFRKIFNTRTYQIPPTNIQSETRYLKNHHRFVLGQDYHYDDCNGGKTGYTSVAKYTLVSVAKRGDLELICVVMRDDSNEHQYTDTKKLFDYGFDNFSIYPINDLESSETITESPMFTKYNALLSDVPPISIDKNGYLILPNSASFQDAKKEVTFYSSTDAAKESPSTGPQLGNKVIGKISYTYNGKYVGGANILYKSTNSLVLIQDKEEKPTAAPSVTSPSDKSGRPLIIIVGIAAGLLILAVVLYYIFVERPRLRRRKAYYHKRANRKAYRDDDYLDL